jgi:hypothetical protein
MQVLNQKTVDILKIRLERDAVSKKLYETQMLLYRTSILAETEYIKISNIKIESTTFVNKAYELEKKYCRNNLLIEIEHRKITEMKLNVINKLIVLDTKNLELFDMCNEMEINALTDSFNYATPDNWEESKVKLLAEKTAIDNEIKMNTAAMDLLKDKLKVHMAAVVKLHEDKKKLETIVNATSHELLALNEKILDDVERQEMMYVRLGEEAPK